MWKWKQIGKTINAQGTTITYISPGAEHVAIESRKRHIPHANRSGTWDHTSYFVLWDGHEVKELYTLRDAKAFAETYKGK